MKLCLILETEDSTLLILNLVSWPHPVIGKYLSELVSLKTCVNIVVVKLLTCNGSLIRFVPKYSYLCGSGIHVVTCLVKSTLDWSKVLERPVWIKRGIISFISWSLCQSLLFLYDFRNFIFFSITSESFMTAAFVDINRPAGIIADNLVSHATRLKTRMTVIADIFVKCLLM
jgi:hypothetical protein